jgi:uncharacterized protein HemX
MSQPQPPSAATPPSTSGYGPPPQPPKKPGWWRSRSTAARIALIAIPVILLAGGGAVAVILTSSSEDRPSVDTTAQAEEKRKAAQLREAQAKYDACKQTTQAFLDKLHELDSRLGVGLSYDEYTDFVGDAQVAYDKTSRDIADKPECVTNVGLPAEQAFNQFVKASRIWDDCFDDIDCDNDSIEPDLQAHWTKGSLAVDRADRGLEEIKKPGG